jgi:hypothetical protein
LTNAATDGKLDITNGATSPTVTITRCAGSTAASNASILMRKARGTLGSESQTLSGDTLGGFFFQGYGAAGAYVTSSVAFRFLASENLTATSYGGYMELETTATGAGTRTLSARFHGGAVYFPSVGTTASAANCYLDNTTTPANSVLRSTSSLRYKTAIEDLDPAKSAAIYSMRPVWYRSLCEADRKDWSWYGLIAEEVAAIEPRLVHYTYLDDQYTITPGDQGEPQTRTLKPDAVMVPDGLQYDRLTVLLLKEIQTLKSRVDGGAQAFPVGSVFTSVVSTNPAALLGYGTWVSFGEGRVLVGVDAGDPDFSTVEKTGGAKAVACSVQNHASHTHTYTQVPNHVHRQSLPSSQTGTQASGTRDTSTTGSVADALSTANPTGGVATATTNAESATLTHTGNTTSVVQPYLTVYFWKRTL